MDRPFEIEWTKPVYSRPFAVRVRTRYFSGGEKRRPEIRLCLQATLHRVISSIYVVVVRSCLATKRPQTTSSGFLGGFFLAMNSVHRSALNRKWQESFASSSAK